jgi:hypothetical protein
MKGKAWCLFLLAVTIAAAACAPKRTYTVDPRLYSGERAIPTVTVVVPRIELKCEKLQGKRGCEGMDRDLRRMLEEVVTEVAAAHGFKVLPGPRLPEEELKPDPEKMARPKAPRTSNRTKAAPKPSMPPTLAPEAMALAKNSGAAGAVLVQGRGELHTGGMQTLAFSADVLVGLVGALACALSPLPICTYAVTNFTGQTRNYLGYEVALMDGRDGAVLLRVWGQASLDDFVAAGAPGKKHYPDQMEKLRGRLTKSLNEKFDAALKGNQ